MAVAGIAENITGIFSNVSEGDLHELRIFVLQSKWFFEDTLDTTHIDITKRIPMFGSFKSRKLVCLCEPTKWLKPDGVREDLLGDDFVRIESEKEKFILRKYLQIKEPAKVEFYKSYTKVCILHDSKASDPVTFGRRILGCLDRLIPKFYPADRDDTSCESEETSDQGLGIYIKLLWSPRKKGNQARADPSTNKSLQLKGVLRFKRKARSPRVCAKEVN
ncbi:hypothetical protein AgCh_038475 [Apium graveolens]